LETPATVTSGLRVPIDLNVQNGQTSNVVLDFDACASVQQRGSTYVLRPLPRLVPAALNGIGGFIDKSVLGSGVVITAQQNGGIYATTVPNPSTGEFFLPRLPVGNFEVVIQGKDRATAVVGMVPVTATAATNVSTSAAPITLASSGGSAISGQIAFTSPAVAPDNGAYILATQTVNANIAGSNNTSAIITYRMQAVDRATGAFTLTNLPRASIQYARYNTTLPLTLVNAGTALGAGRYRVETMATGFTNKTTTASANVNVSAGDATGIAIPLP
jgi:hypothetical protein